MTSLEFMVTIQNLKNRDRNTQTTKTKSGQHMLHQNSKFLCDAQNLKTVYANGVQCKEEHVQTVFCYEKWKISELPECHLLCIFLLSCDRKKSGSCTGLSTLFFCAMLHTRCSSGTMKTENNKFISNKILSYSFNKNKNQQNSVISLTIAHCLQHHQRTNDRWRSRDETKDLSHGAHEHVCICWTS